MADSSSSEPVRDYLEVDDPIPGQHYVCMSFVSPEEAIADRNLFMQNAFLKTIAKKYDLDSETILDTYRDFLYINEESLDKEFSQKNDFRTSVRGVKIRGTYDSIQEAERRAKLLQRTDPVHNVFVGQVGYWLPWDPEPHKIKQQEYAEKELNELVHKYEENQEARKVAFNKRVEREMEEAKRKSEEQKEKNRLSVEASKETGDESVQQENVLEEVMEQRDAWSQHQSDSKDKTNSTKETETSSDDQET